MKTQWIHLFLFGLIWGIATQSAFAQSKNYLDRKLKTQHTRVLPSSFLEDVGAAYSSDSTSTPKSIIPKSSRRLSTQPIKKLKNQKAKRIAARPVNASAPIPKKITPTPKAEEVPGSAWDEFQNPEDCEYDPLAGVLAPGRGHFFAGLEYLYVRPHFSEPTAYVRGTDPGTFINGVRQITLETVPYVYDYESSFRTYIGYRLCDCCAEVKLGFTRLAGSDSKSEAANGNSSPSFFEVQPIPGGNEVLVTNSNVRGNIADLEFSRCIQLGDECQTCCSCPRWDLRWKAGIRFADLGHSRSGYVANDPGNASFDNTVDFQGGGPIIGMSGRRYFGSNGQFSIYSNWELALLLGDYENQLTTRNMPTTNLTTTTWKTDLLRTVPMTGIEIGASWQATDRWTLSAGWLFQAWWDMGMTDDFPDDGHIRDDANIMSWDGLTLRAEMAF